MVFSSPIFLFAFLPLVLAAYFVSPHHSRNLLLLTASLLFFAWGEPVYAWVLPISLAGNYLAGLAIDGAKTERRRGCLLGVAITCNLGLLVAFKYAHFIAENLNPLVSWLGLRPFRLAPVHLPLGVSFFTFQGIAYIVDVARGHVPAERNPILFGVTGAMFAHLVAGPIVRYRDIVGQLGDRRVPLDEFAAGVRRIVVGLAKKVLLANTLAVAADQAFRRPPAEVGLGAAWLGLVCYALQIYFDFSGYSDMAIGLGRLFGFTFPENFRHPYVASSLTEFWRRWHITLSTWFRDYVYIPLGGSRRGRWRVLLNLLLVFTLCGLWHGAAWTFLLWGLWHGAFLIAERIGGGGTIWLRHAVTRHVWTILAVLGGWVFFRAESVGQACGYFAALAGAGHGLRVTDILGRDVALALLVGIPACLPLAVWIRGLWSTRPRWDWLLATADVAACAGLLFAAAVNLIGGGYNPFLYFRF
jgi:alginate O-acetyltransferase complex protein AlgI